MASNNSLVAASAANMAESTQLLQQLLENPEVQNDQQGMKVYLEEFQKKLNGKTMLEVVSDEGFNAKAVIEMFPEDFIANIAKAFSLSDDETKDLLTKMTEPTVQLMAQARAELANPSDPVEPEFQGVKRVQTMLDGQDVETMQFDPLVQKLIDSFPSMEISGPSRDSSGPNPQEIIQKMLSKDMIEKMMSGTFNPNELFGEDMPGVENMLESLPAAAAFKPAPTSIPIANPELAKENLAAYLKQVDDFIKTMSDPDASHSALAAMIVTLKRCSLRFECHEPDTLADIQPIVLKIQDALFKMEWAVTCSDKNGPSLAVLNILLNAEQQKWAEENAASSEALRKLWDEISADIDSCIEKRHEAEAEAEAAVAADLD